MQENMAKMAAGEGGDEPTVERLKEFSSLSMNVPGDGNVDMAAGMVKRNSARKYANAMDAVVGPAGPAVREPVAAPRE